MCDSCALKAEIVSARDAHGETGIVCAVDRGILSVETRCPYEEGERVFVRVGGCEASGRVVYSLLRERTFRTVIELRHARANRRTERRIPFGHPALVTVIAETGGEAFDGVITDMSSSGAGVRSTRELRTGDTISVETRSCVVFGEVVYCARREDGHFDAGVRVAEMILSRSGRLPGSRWGWFRRLIPTVR